MGTSHALRKQTYAGVVMVELKAQRAPACCLHARPPPSQCRLLSALGNDAFRVAAECVRASIPRLCNAVSDLLVQCWQGAFALLCLCPASTQRRVVLGTDKGPASLFVAAVHLLQP